MKKTVGSEFEAIRIAKSMTMLDVAKKCDVSESVVWKVAHDWPVRWETIHLILKVAFRVTPKAEAYREMQALWLKARQERAEALPESHGKQLLSKHATEASRKFRMLIRDMAPGDVKAVLDAAKRAAAKVTR